MGVVMGVEVAVAVGVGLGGMTVAVAVGVGEGVTCSIWGQSQRYGVFRLEEPTVAL